MSNMNNPQPQQLNNSDKSAAALSFATMLSEQLLKQQNKPQVEEQSPEPSQTAPESTETPQESQEQDNLDSDLMMHEYEAGMADLETKMETMKTDLQDTMRAEISKITESIKEALKDE